MTLFLIVFLSWRCGIGHKSLWLVGSQAHTSPNMTLLHSKQYNVDLPIIVFDKFNVAFLLRSLYKTDAGLLTPFFHGSKNF